MRAIYSHIAILGAGGGGGVLTKACLRIDTHMHLIVCLSLHLLLYIFVTGVLILVICSPTECPRSGGK